ncbi:MAG: NAD(P)H-dependent oxidoreductase [Proteobacteria bacterium]|nr:NAD(P)H-dependent oxidoreductase [Pseudomonadota bacterium]NDC24840.1 NAD(P)H-dependent oxidoreductase [Pseudomonadota bacterium]NDD05308.1 NAD(P)H-dependent oxidoreductase [Pseudomonadota bacterium]NDG27302.1 NAD(P)H-dependent oxidoreductase [Pseudomonadota bacterium]
MTNQLIEQLKWRYAVKKFDNQKKISSQDWKALEESLILTPSSYGLQPWKFVVVQEPKVRKLLTPHSWNQTQVEDCSHFVVFAARTSVNDAYLDFYFDEISRIRGVAKESTAGYRKMIASDLQQGPRSKNIAEWAVRQSYIALGNLMTCAALLKIDTCPMEGISPPQYDEILGLNKTDYRTAVACAVGYRSSEDKYALAKKVRFEPEKLIQTI